MAPLAEKEVAKIDNQTEQKEQTHQNDSVKREEKAQKMKERLLNAQARGVEERKAANASADMSPELKQEMEKFFVWTPPPPPETMGEKLKRKVKQNPIVPIGALATVGALTYGLFSFIRGDTKMQQYMMRARVAAQGGTIVAVAAGVAFMLFRDSQNKKS
ncbi:unnamed protein product [Porites lobata]|uniref:HIG1 domain-containing protein n=1 Tax=Porites lobata TaxID=104759 RepID=A0ABN8NWX8_9CNID|nr:unnamed protein product [Porites lobata]